MTRASRRRRSAARPGVRSARYAGEDAGDQQNLDKLLAEAPAGSALEYVCAIAYVDPARGVERVFEGRCAGRLAEQPRGARGFGYDPAFLPDDGPRGADDGPAERRAEGRDQPSRSRGAGAVRLAGARRRGRLSAPRSGSGAQSRLIAAAIATARPSPA